MKITKDVSKLIYWRGGTGNGPTELIKNTEIITLQRNQIQTFKEV